MADRTTTRRNPFLYGLVALAGSTVMLCIGSSITVLIIGRLLQGISAAVVWAVGLALLVDTVGKDEIGRSMGIISVATSAAVFLAPLLGGIVYDRGGYYAGRFEFRKLAASLGRLMIRYSFRNGFRTCKCLVACCGLIVD